MWTFSNKNMLAAAKEITKAEEGKLNNKVLARNLQILNKFAKKGE